MDPCLSYGELLSVWHSTFSTVSCFPSSRTGFNVALGFWTPGSHWPAQQWYTLFPPSPCMCQSQDREAHGFTTGLGLHCQLHVEIPFLTIVLSSASTRVVCCLLHNRLENAALLISEVEEMVQQKIKTVLFCFPLEDQEEILRTVKYDLFSNLLYTLYLPKNTHKHKYYSIAILYNTK
jgi:hypothetical protein